jgi:ABC-type taurine transport system substrate-binding protein
MTTKRALSGPIITVYVSLAFSLTAHAASLNAAEALVGAMAVDAEKYPEVVARFAKVTLDSFAEYAAQGSSFPDAKAQQTTALLDGGTAKAIGETAKFLKEQGKVETVLADYSPYVSAKFVTD